MTQLFVCAIMYDTWENWSGSSIAFRESERQLAPHSAQSTALTCTRQTHTLIRSTGLEARAAKNPAMREAPRWVRAESARSPALRTRLCGSQRQEAAVSHHGAVSAALHLHTSHTHDLTHVKSHPAPPAPPFTPTHTRTLARGRHTAFPLCAASCASPVESRSLQHTHTMGTRKEKA